MKSYTKKATVLHLVESGGMYGAEHVILNLSLEMQRSGTYEPIVGCIVQDALEYPALCERARSAGIRTELFQIKNTRLPVHYVRFIRRLNAISPDIIHSHGYKPSVYAYPAGRMAGIPVTATCHLWYVDTQSRFTMPIMIRLEKALYRRFPVVFAVSPAIREILLAAGVSDERIHLVNNGIPLPDTSRPDNGTRRWQAAAQFGVDPNEICIVNAGRLAHQKSQHTLVEAASILRARGRNFKFLIAGEGELRDILQRRIADEGLTNTVKLLGFTECMADLLSVANVFVLPSLDEGMPISLLEAVAHKVPIVATNVGAITNLIENEFSGLIIPTESPDSVAAAIEYIVDKPDQRKLFTQRAYATLEATFSSRAMFNEYDRYYRVILQRTPEAEKKNR